MTASNKAFGKRRRLWLGSLAALFSAITFSMNVTLAGLAYQHGANIHALNITRAVLFWLVLLAVARINGLALNIPNKVKLTCVLLGVLLGIEMYVLLGAVVFIPVALAIVTMYTYPLMIGIYDWISKRDRFSYLQLILMFFVFAGLFLALSVPTGMVNTSGVLLAFAAAVVLATLLILSERAMSQHENTVVMLYMLTGTCASIVLFLIFVDLEWPTTPIGWLAFTGSGGCYVVATFLLFTAVDMVGPLRTAIIDNTSPVWAVLFGFLLLGQALSLTQILGVVIVVSGVLGIQWVKRERT
ncbi:MAG: DMT family transporter [Arenicellales bacterium]|nr:DMT family transporter [Arenicellales bacterium]